MGLSKEEKRSYRKKWRENNIEKVRASSKKWRDNNKDKIREDNLRHKGKGKLDFYIVYGLMCGYVGKTNNPYKRMSVHKYSGRDTEGWFILNIVKTSREALDLEGEYHRKGHSGHNGNPFIFEGEAKTRKEKMLEYQKKYRNSPKGKENRKNYSTESKHKIKEYSKSYREKNKEKIKEYQKRYRAMKKLNKE